MQFDPDAAGKSGAGIFGLPFGPEEAEIILLPVPFDATTSYGHGTAAGPAAIYEASMQVDLYDRRHGRIYERGIFLKPEDPNIRGLSFSTRQLTEPIIAKGGAEAADAGVIERIDAAGDQINQYTYSHTQQVLKAGKVPGLIGGDHSTPFGAIRACAEHIATAGAQTQLGILHIDAHMDFRVAYEGFRWSHASIMYNVLSQIPQVQRVVQVGIRDFGEGEVTFGVEQGQRAITYYDIDWAERLESGTAFLDLAKEAIAHLPQNIYISFDIDALDPALCPHTGTPVPGGLTFNQACLLLDSVKAAGKKVVGFDLVEVTPGTNSEWDANVGARLLYRLCGLCG